MLFKKMLKSFCKKQNIATEIVTKGRKDTYISKKEYMDLVSYANERNVKIARFKRFTGDISIIKEVIDDIVIVANDFPQILKGKKRLELNLDYYCDEDVFATTEHHLVYLNASLFSDVQYLKTEYEIAMLQGKL